MKKHLLALLILLFLLIVTCVYQKTYTFYANAHTDDNTSIHTQNEQTVLSIKSKENEIITKPETITETKLETSTKATSSKIEKNEVTPSTNVVTKETEELKTPATITTESNDKEIIAYLLSVLNQRAEAEATLHAHIKQVLEDRGIAIENMHKVSLEIEKAHKERLIERDTKTHNNSQEKGK